MAYYCIVCHDEFDEPGDYINVHTDCLGVEDALKRPISRGVKGLSRRVVNGVSTTCKLCKLPGTDASIRICMICFTACRKRILSNSQAIQKEQERIDQVKKLDRERFVKMTSGSPDFEIKVCSSCNLPIRPIDSRCDCS